MFEEYKMDDDSKADICYKGACLATYVAPVVGLTGAIALDNPLILITGCIVGFFGVPLGMLTDHYLEKSRSEYL